MSKKRARRNKEAKRKRLAAAGYIKARDPIAYDHAHGPRIKGGPQGGSKREQLRRERKAAKQSMRED